MQSLFEIWLQEVNRLVKREIGLDVTARADEYRKQYESGVSTTTAAESAIVKFRESAAEAEAAAEEGGSEDDSEEEKADDDEEVVGYCDAADCLSEAGDQVNVSVDEPHDEARNYCFSCLDVYYVGVQHGRHHEAARYGLQPGRDSSQHNSTPSVVKGNRHAVLLAFSVEELQEAIDRKQMIAEVSLPPGLQPMTLTPGEAEIIKSLQDDQDQPTFEGKDLPKSKLYELTQYEIWTRKYHAITNSRAQAVAILFADKATAVPDSAEMVEVDMDHGMNCDEEDESFTDELRNLEIRLDDEMLPSIKDVVELAADDTKASAADDMKASAAKRSCEHKRIEAGFADAPNRCLDCGKYLD